MVQRSKSYLIDVHHHPLPPFYKALLDDVGSYYTAGGNPLPTWSPQDSLRMMDENGIAAAVFNMPAWGVYSTTIARRNNEYWAKVVQDYPGKFGACAFLYFPDLEGALKEVEYSLDQLKLDGVCMLTNHQDHYPADPEYDELFAELNRRKMVVAFHANVQPGPPLGKAKLRPDLPAGWIDGPVELTLNTTRTVLQLLRSGRLERYPDIRWFFPQNSLAIPVLAEKFTEPQHNEGQMALLKRQYYLFRSDSGPSALRALQEFTEPTHILWGTDYGLGTDLRASSRRVGESIKRLREHDSFDKKTLALVEHGNALALFPRLKKYFKE